MFGSYGDCLRSCGFSRPNEGMSAQVRLAKVQSTPMSAKSHSHRNARAALVESQRFLSTARVAISDTERKRMGRNPLMKRAGDVAAWISLGAVVAVALGILVATWAMFADVAPLWFK